MGWFIPALIGYVVAKAGRRNCGPKRCRSCGEPWIWGTRCRMADGYWHIYPGERAPKEPK